MRQHRVVAALIVIALAWLSAACDSDPAPVPATATPAPETEADPMPPSIEATNAFYYYTDVDAAWRFYTEVLGMQTVADYGFAKILRVAPTSYLTLVDAERGMHSADGFELRTEEIGDESGRVRVFVGYDPEGYFLEWDTFLDVEGNEELVRQLRRQ